MSGEGEFKKRFLKMAVENPSVQGVDETMVAASFLNWVDEAAKEFPMKLTTEGNGGWLWSWDTEQGIIVEIQKWFVKWFGVPEKTEKEVKK